MSPDLVETTFDVAAMFPLTSGSTMMFSVLLKGELPCPLANDNDVLYVTVVPPLCCPPLKLKVFAIVCPVSPDDPDPTATAVVDPSSKFQVYCCVAEKAEFAPGFVAVLFVNVTGNPLVASSLIPLTTPPAAEYATVWVE